MARVLAYLLARAGERSTWQGLIALAAAFGWAADPHQVQAVAAEAVFALGVLHVVFPQSGVIGRLRADVGVAVSVAAPPAPGA